MKLVRLGNHVVDISQILYIVRQSANEVFSFKVGFTNGMVVEINKRDEDGVLDQLVNVVPKLSATDLGK